MSKGYTSNGKRISAMTHAKHGHTCQLCGRVVFGNGGEASHGRAHVRKGEAVELVKHYESGLVAPSRAFMAPGDERVRLMLARGWQREEA